MRPPFTHCLKTLAPYFQNSVEGWKPFEIRRDDRAEGFQVGDTLLLMEWASLGPGRKMQFTGRQVKWLVSYVLSGGAFGLEPGFVCMGLVKKLPAIEGVCGEQSV